MKEIKAWLKREDMSQGDLARMVQTDRFQVSRWMNGQKPSTSSLLRLADATGISLEKLARGWK